MKYYFKNISSNFLIATLIIFLSINVTSSFHFFKKNIDLQKLIKEAKDSKLEENTNECLVSKEEAEIILSEKYNLNPAYIDIDENLRFILGKCYPIIYVPALYASRLMATFNCPVFKKDFLNFVKMRLFCGTDICSDESNTNDEFVMFPAAFNSPFKLTVSGETNKYTSCLGYFFTYYNHKNECAENICNYSDGVRLSFYGATKNTKNDSKCGIKALEDLIYGGELLPPIIANKLSTGNIYKMVQRFRKMGYKEGFSVAGMSFDYRRFIFKNDYFNNAFEYEVNRLYRNTGKPVIIITQSLGGLNALDQLIKINNDLRKKIKSYVPIGPPYQGSMLATDIFYYDFDGFDTEVKISDIEILKVEINALAQYIAFKPTPAIAELRPSYGLIEALKKPEYEKLKNALSELLNVEKECGNINCNKSKIINMTKNYVELFGEDFPSLADESCQLDDDQIYENETQYIDKTVSFPKRCRTNVFDFINCPSLVHENDLGSKNVSALRVKELCNIYNSSLFYVEKDEEINKLNNILFDDKKYTLDYSYYNSSKYPYNLTEFYYLLNRYNKNYAEKYNKTLSIEDFDSYEKVENQFPKNIEYIKKNGKIESLPIPPIDTYLIYGNFYGTISSILYDPTDKDKKVPEDNEIYYKGGDGTVPPYSTFFTGLKWLYDKKINNLTQNIKLVEYCASIGKQGNKYAYDHETYGNKTFIALSCECINEDHKSYGNVDNCLHSGMVGDKYVLEFIANEILFDDNNLVTYSDEKKKAIKDYSKNIDYEQGCNEALYQLFQEDMEKIEE